MDKKIGIFVDVQNIYYTCRHAYQKQFNYRAFWSLISQQGDIQVANAYAIARADDQQIKFQDALRHIGFTVKLKPFIQRSDGSAKGDWDVGISIDVIEHSNDLDEVVLLSGDGDFALLLQHVKQRYAVTTQVFSAQQLTAKALFDVADTYTSIDSIPTLLK